MIIIVNRRYIKHKFSIIKKNTKHQTKINKRKLVLLKKKIKKKLWQRKIRKIKTRLKRFKFILKFRKMQIIWFKVLRYYFIRSIYMNGYVILINQIWIYSFITYKLKISSVKYLPDLKGIYWRGSFIVTKKHINKKIGYLLNLYFIFRIKFLKYFLIRYFNGSIKDYTKGWIVKINNDLLSKYVSIDELVNKIIFESRLLTLTNVNSNWGFLKPYGWITIFRGWFLNLIIYRRRDDWFYERYWDLEGWWHQFLQYKILCQLPNEYNYIISTRISIWYLKVIIIRLFGYPVLYRYKQLRIIELLSKFGGYDNILTLNIFDTIETTWQANPTAVAILSILTGLGKVLTTSIMTEWLQIKVWMDAINQKKTFSFILRYQICCQNPAILIKILKKNKNIKLNFKKKRIN